MADLKPLQIHPLVLYFPPPLNRIITNIVRLRNITQSSWVAYKVKTTKPERYCVRPNLGVVPPNETLELQIHFSNQRDPPNSLRCHDKFQIESIVLSPEQAANRQKLTLAELFKAAQNITEEKLKVRFARKASSGSTAITMGEPTEELDSSLAQPSHKSWERDEYALKVKELQGQLDAYKKKDLNSVGLQGRWPTSAGSHAPKKSNPSTFLRQLSLMLLVAVLFWLLGYYHVLL